MNRKNKKNKNKPPNPLPPQESDQNANINPENVEKTEERVPEIVSEVVSPETKEGDNDSPKKPRRNRGKKKKNDQDEDTTDEPKDEAQGEGDGKTDVPMAPANRKKKGKPKANDPVPETPKTETKVTEVTSDITDTPKSPEPNDGKKKKNKKNKKRTDSEMSDKADEISCTSAFQKILQPPEPKVDMKDIKSEENVKETKAQTDVKKVESIKPEIKPLEAKVKEAIPVPPPPPPQEFLTKIQPVADKSEHGDQFEDQKGKKKKKDKKYPKELEQQDLITALILGEAKIDPKANMFEKKLEAEKRKHEKKDKSEKVDKPNKELEKDSTKNITDQPKNITNIPDKEQKETEKTTEKSVVNKNVIVLKYKEDQEIKPSEVKTEVINEEASTPKDIFTHAETPKDADNFEEQIKLEQTTKSKAKIAKPVDKKSKGKQNVELPCRLDVDSPETKIEKSETPIALEDKSDNKSYVPIAEEIQPKMPAMTELLSPIPVKPTQKAKSVEKDNPLKSKQPTADEVIQQILAESISMEAKMEAITIPADNNQKLDTESSKKHKKSPKPQRKSENITPQKPITPEPSEIKTEEKTDIVESKTDSPITEKTFAPIPDEISLSDIEKDVSYASDITPDQIEPPRSLSQQLIDPNNNTFIREVFTSTLDVTAVIPDTPFITGPNEPLSVQVTAKIAETKIESPVSKDEKTDLKSKVMEVNQDMEELRLSIERSLAEFTSMEKEEKKRPKKDDLIIVTCAEIKTEVKPEPLIIETTKLDKIDEIQEKTPEIRAEVINPLKIEINTESLTSESSDIPIPPQRKDNKGKNKSKKKGKQEVTHQQSAPSSESTATATQETKGTTQDTKKEEKSEKQEKSESKEEGKKQADADEKQDPEKSFETNQTDDQIKGPIENFEDALTSSVDDVNKTFEMIANDCEEDDKKEQGTQNENTISQPKNLLGHTDIPVPSNRTDYKKERNKTPNTKQAKVKIKDSVDVEKTKINKECQTSGRPTLGRNKTINESVTCVTNENEEYVYKYSFRKVFLSNICQVCKMDLKDKRIPCNFCYLIFYCSEKHKEEDVAQHSGLCFAVSTIAHLKGQKHIYGDAAGTTGHSYRLLRMQAIVSAEKILKRRLAPWEQEALLYPRVCADGGCREWRQGELMDCGGCGQVAFCTSHPNHLPKIHARWCKSYTLYQKLVIHQLTMGRLEPKLPNKVLTHDRLTDNINRLLADMYDEKIDMNDIQYASLTQLATAPLTTAYSHQMYRIKMDALTNVVQMPKTFTIHVVGAELQFEADTLNKWETFFLHLKPEVEELLVVLVGAELNPSNLPLDLLGKIKLCARCRVDRRKLTFRFQDKVLYHEYYASDDYVSPDIVCAFNPSIHRSSNYIRNDTWSSTINCILRTKKPFLITSYTMTELQRDVATVKKCAEEPFNLVSEPKFNPFASVRPDRNFISDDEIPLLFKNYCYSVLIGAF